MRYGINPSPKDGANDADVNYFVSAGLNISWCLPSECATRDQLLSTSTSAAETAQKCIQSRSFGLIHCSSITPGDGQEFLPPMRHWRSRHRRPQHLHRAIAEAAQIERLQVRASESDAGQV